MPLPDIDFKQIREHDGSRHHGFEELCCQLASLEPRSAEAEFYRKGRGADAGVECFFRYRDGKETGWQVKYYWAMDSNLLRSIDDSIETALRKHPYLTTYIVCIPFDLSDPRTGNDQSALDKWERWRDKWITYTVQMGRVLNISRWDASTLKERLTRDTSLLAGRLLFWFNKQSLSHCWFKKVFAEVRADLGSRYTAETNVELPIRRALLGLARDPLLAVNLKQWSFRIHDAGTYAINAVEQLVPHKNTAIPTGLKDTLEYLKVTLFSFTPSVTRDFPIDQWRNAIQETICAVNDVSEWCYNNSGTHTHDHDQKLSYATHALRKLQSVLVNIDDDITSDLWSIVNDRQVLIFGEGGIGKSHLLADVAQYQVERNRPAVLLLGQHFKDDDPWPQIVRRLELPLGTTTDQFLGALDAAAQAADVRGLFLIDALNEKYGATLWHDRLAGFLEKFKQYKYLAVVLSCRTTYLDRVVPTTLNDSALRRLQHRGFRFADTRAYLRTRGMVLPGAPIPSPGFENPLLLKSCCDALQQQGLKEFPRGLSGTTAIFDYYQSVVVNIVNRRLDLSERRKAVESFIDSMTDDLIQSGEEYVTLKRAFFLADRALPSSIKRETDIVFHLESEGLLTVERLRLVEGDADDEGVRFTFQRFSDHAVASHLLRKYFDSAEPAAAFRPEGALHRFVTTPLVWRRAGVVEALSVQLPERAGVELPDAIPPECRYGVAEAFRASLLWRDQQKFTNRTMTLVSELLGQHQELRVLLSVATEPTNKYNARFLHDKLISMRMPDRDARWSTEIAELGAESDSPVWTIIDWAWSDGFDVIEAERAELTGIILAWFLTTSHRGVRDRATKALIALLAPRLKLSIALLSLFWEVDDDYVRERLLAAVYGALLQGRGRDLEIGEVAGAVYDLLFAAGAPPVNALMRDHGRCITEFAHHRGCLPDYVNLELARPPYRSRWPLEAVPDSLLDTYTCTYRTGWQGRDQIVGSCVSNGDFARYVIDSYVSNWSPAPIGASKLPTNEEVSQQWTDEFRSAASPAALEAFIDLDGRILAATGQARDAERPETQALTRARECFRAAIGPLAWEDYRTRAGRWWAEGMFNALNHTGIASFDLAWARRWVCMRAHQLGWSETLHGAFDNGHLITHDRTSHSIERIGKKYQWLSLYELGARLTDNCAYTRGSDEDKVPGVYEGENFTSLRDLDPSLLVRKSHDDAWTDFREPTWWAPILPRYTPTNSEERLHWLYGDEDRIDGEQCLDVVDRGGRRWLVLHGFIMSREKAHNNILVMRNTWSRISCCVVPKEDLDTLLQELKGETLTSPDSLPKGHFYSGNFYLGEYPWHPQLKHVTEWDEWRRTSGGVSLRIRPVIAEYTCEMGTYDYSVDETVHVVLPAPWIMQAMGLRLSDGHRLTYVGDCNVSRFFDPALTETGPHAGLVDHDAFLSCLEQEGLAALWVIAGEKRVYSELGTAFGGENAFTSIYWMKDRIWNHRLTTVFSAPDKKQVEPLFDGRVPGWVRTRDEDPTTD